MENNCIDPSLLFLEVPLYQNDLVLPRHQEIIINEGKIKVSLRSHHKQLLLMKPTQIPPVVTITF